MADTWTNDHVALYVLIDMYDAQRRYTNGKTMAQMVFMQHLLQEIPEGKLPTEPKGLTLRYLRRFCNAIEIERC